MLLFNYANQISFDAPLCHQPLPKYREKNNNFYDINKP